MAARQTAPQPSAPFKVDLTGQVAIVTGASQGIGRAIAQALGAAGAKVACVARNAEKLSQTVESIRSQGGTAEAIPYDVSDAASVDKLVDGVVEKWERLNIMVNNAGITRDTLIPRMTDDDWDSVINTNLRGAFLFTRAATRTMMSARYGRIVNIAS